MGAAAAGAVAAAVWGALTLHIEDILATLGATASITHISSKPRLMRSREPGLPYASMPPQAMLRPLPPPHQRGQALNPPPSLHSAQAPPTYPSPKAPPPPLSVLTNREGAWKACWYMPQGPAPSPVMRPRMYPFSPHSALPAWAGADIQGGVPSTCRLSCRAAAAPEHFPLPSLEAPEGPSSGEDG